MATTVPTSNATVKIRHPLAPLALGFVTLGIYLLVWYYLINRELRQVTGRGDPLVSLLAITVGSLLVVPPFVSWYSTADRIRSAQRRVGMSSQISPLLALALTLVPIANLFAPVYLQHELNQAWRRGGLAAQ